MNAVGLEQLTKWSDILSNEAAPKGRREEACHGLAKIRHDDALLILFEQVDDLELQEALTGAFNSVSREVSALAIGLLEAPLEGDTIWPAAPSGSGGSITHRLELRRKSMRALGMFTGPHIKHALPVLERALFIEEKEDEEAWVSKEAAHAIRRIGARSSTPKLLQAFEELWYGPRRVAYPERLGASFFAAMEGLRDPASLPTIVSFLLENPDGREYGIANEAREAFMRLCLDAKGAEELPAVWGEHLPLLERACRDPDMGRWLPDILRRLNLTAKEKS